METSKEGSHGSGGGDGARRDGKGGGERASSEGAREQRRVATRVVTTRVWGGQVNSRWLDERMRQD
jgi:hypothetical protein